MQQQQWEELLLTTTFLKVIAAKNNYINYFCLQHAGWYANPMLFAIAKATTITKLDVFRFGAMEHSGMYIIVFNINILEGYMSRVLGSGSGKV